MCWSGAGAVIGEFGKRRAREVASPRTSIAGYEVLIVEVQGQWSKETRAIHAHVTLRLIRICKKREWKVFVVDLLSCPG